MSQGRVGFFAGGFVEDENTTSKDPLPKEGDGKVNIHVDSAFAGGSATNAAVTFGGLSRLNPRTAADSLAHLYTKSQKSTPDHIVADLEHHLVHLKKLGILPVLRSNTVVSWPGGGRLILKRGDPKPDDPTLAQKNALSSLFNLRDMAAGLNNEALQKAIERLSKTVQTAFDEANGHTTHVAENIENQFASDLEGSDIVMVDMKYPDITLKVAQAAQNMGKTVVLDLGGYADHAQEIIDLSNIILASHDFRINKGEHINPEDILGFLKSRGKSRIAVTRGAKPTLFADHGHKGEIVIPEPSKVVSSSAAGDIHKGAFCYFYARTGNFGHSLWEANRISALSVMFPDARQFLKHIEFDGAGEMRIPMLDNKPDAPSPSI